MKNWWETITSWFKPKPTPTPTPTPVDPNLLKGYGMVSYWLTLTDFDALISALKNNRCNCTSIEFFGRYEDNWAAKPDVIKAKFNDLVVAARKQGIKIFVNIMNWGNTTYIANPDSWFQDWLNFIKSFGPSCFIVQAASEWHDDKGARWCQMAENTLSGFVLSWNKGSRPSTATSKYAYIDYHSASMSDYGVADKRIVCDTDSEILNEMENGGVMGQTFIPEKVKQFAFGAFAQGKGVLLYGYNHKQVDVEAIKALGL